MSKLPEYASDHVHDLSTLSDDQIPRTIDGKHGLLVFGLDLDEAHGRSAHSFADRFGIGRIRLAALKSYWL